MSRRPKHSARRAPCSLPARQERRRVRLLQLSTSSEILFLHLPNAAAADMLKWLAERTRALPSPAATARRTNRESTFPWMYVGFGLAIFAALYALANWGEDSASEQRPIASKGSVSTIPFDGQRAFGYLRDLCAIGPRVAGTEGMQRQQTYLQSHFEKLGAKVTRQPFLARHPQTGKSTQLANLIVEWHPDRQERLLLCAHYDTRPFPDQDPFDKQGIFLGANDGASGTALLCELGNVISKIDTRYGIDFVLFDGEELVFDGARDPYFLGSEHFAREYAANPPAHRYQCGILLDMVADANLQILPELNSKRTPAQRQIVNQVWSIARELGVREFLFGNGHEIRDDHLPLNEIAKIPTIDIIDFDYPAPRSPSYWHTTRDVPENCSPQSLAKVGWVIKTWLERYK